ncbi:TolB family protein [Elusimicrobiota bacterium]
MKNYKKIVIKIIVLILFNGINIYGENKIIDYENVNPEKIKPGKIVKLISDANSYSKAKWSSKGNMIALRKIKGKNLKVIDINSRERIEIEATEIDETSWDYSWAPDGERIAFTGRKWVNKDEVDHILGIVEIETDKRKLIKKDIKIVERLKKDISKPTWSPNGSELFYKIDENDGVLHKKEISIKNQKIAYSINKVYEEHKKIFIVDDSGKKIKIANYGYNPEILEDGRVRYQIDSKFYIETNGDTREVYSKFESRHGYWKDGKQYDEIETNFIEQTDYTISPDGNFIIYADVKDDGHRIISSDLRIKKIGENESYSLTNTPDKFEIKPSWSSDGSKIIYQDVAPKKWGIYLMELNVE